MLKAANLDISAYGADLAQAPFYSNDPEVRRRARRLFEDCLELCVDCGIPLMRVDTLAERQEMPAPTRVIR